MMAASDAELAAFVGTSAAILGLQLDDEAQAAVLNAMRGLLSQVALVLDYPESPAAP
jgi:hypothetical protein